MKQYEQVKELINDLSLSDTITLINLYASNEDYSYYIFEDLDEVLSLHYEGQALTVDDLRILLEQFSEVNPYSSDYVWVDGYGDYQQGTAREAIDDKFDMDMLVEFCIDCPDEVEDIIEVPEEEDEEDAG